MIMFIDFICCSLIVRFKHYNIINIIYNIYAQIKKGINEDLFS